MLVKEFKSLVSCAINLFLYALIFLALRLAYMVLSAATFYSSTLSLLHSETQDLFPIFQNYIINIKSGFLKIIEQIVANKNYNYSGFQQIFPMGFRSIFFYDMIQ